MPSSFTGATLPLGAPLSGSALLAVDRALELLLVHARAALDAELPRLVVELVAGASLRPAGPRPLAAAPAGRHVARRRPGRPARLARPRALLVDCPRGDLLRPLGRRIVGRLALVDV